MTSRLRGDGRRGREFAERELTDARPVSEHARRLAADPAAIRRLKMRRRALVLGLVGVCVAGSVAAFVGQGGYRDMTRLRNEIAELRTEIEQRQAVIESIRDDVHALGQEPFARERIAREQLGLVRPGEIDFLLPKETDPVWPDRPMPSE